MITIVNCIATQHNIWFVLLAAAVCTIGATITLNLLRKALETTRMQRYGWHFLIAVASGSTVWCTHFIAMLAYEPDAPVILNQPLTLLSLAIAIVGTGIGFVIATGGFTRASPMIGGAMVGLSIAAMHYTGMLAYRVDGIVEWNEDFFYASIILAVIFSALSTELAVSAKTQHQFRGAIALLILAVISLHFTGMTALSVTPMALADAADHADKMYISIAVAAAGLVVLGTGLSSYLIANRVNADNMEKLRHLANHDVLTALPNRSRFLGELNEQLRSADKENRQVALIGIDLDRFKQINDTFGHNVGDRILCELSDRMRKHLAEGELIGRFGGDEFAAFKSFDQESALQDFITRLTHALNTRLLIDNTLISVGASLGVAIYPKDATDSETLTVNADMAMYRAKHDAHSSVCYYEAGMDEAARLRAGLAHDIWVGLDEGQFYLNYQVQRSITNRKATGYEVLLRWHHPVHGEIPPSVFIPIAEECGAIVQLGEWVLQRACSEARNWPTPARIAVNISPLQLASVALIDTVKNVLIQTGLSSSRLELEVTENAIILDKERALHILRQIKALGVTIAIDDFGTGYSSLDTLRYFPFDKIKLDRSFVVELEDNQLSKAFVRAILALGQSLDIPVLAEGVETQRQLAILEEEGCHQVQGFLLGRPAFVAQSEGPVEFRAA